MIKPHVLLLLALVVAPFTLANPSVPNFLPQPKEVSFPEARFHEITESSRIFYQDQRDAPRAIESTLDPLADLLASEIEMLTGIRPITIGQSGAETVAPPGAGDIVLRFTPVEGEFAFNEADEDQSYEIAGSAGKELEIQSQYYKGVAYGTATLLQSITEDDGTYRFPAIDIKDEPAVAYRSIMVDIARAKHSLDTLRSVIRAARLFKIRYFHVHLSDNERFTYGFPPILEAFKKSGRQPGDHYTLEEWQALVRYADVRGVTLIPEVDLPAHSGALRYSKYFPYHTNEEGIPSEFEMSDERNFEALEKLLDSVLETFHSSPYYHGGGDEAAGGATPYLKRLNTYLRDDPPGGKRRLLFWEGINPIGQLPATGEDRAIIMVWEGHGAAEFLEADFEVINATWNPMYIIPKYGIAEGAIPFTTYRYFPPEGFFNFTKGQFGHMSKNAAIVKGILPNDQDKNDFFWHADYIERDKQVLGAQTCVWEGQDASLMEAILPRLPVLAERLWSPEAEDDFEAFRAKGEAAFHRVLPIIQPIEVLPGVSEGVFENPNNRVFGLYHPAAPGSEITLRNRTKLKGKIQYALGGFHGMGWFMDFPEDSPFYEVGIPVKGDQMIKARLVLDGGRVLSGETYKAYKEYTPRVKVTEYDMFDYYKPYEQDKYVPDLAALPEKMILRRFEAPMLRGSYIDHLHLGVRSETDFIPPETKEYEINYSGSTTFDIYLDLNADGEWQENELIDEVQGYIVDEWLTYRVTLEKGKRYRLRMDCATRANEDGNIGAMIKIDNISDSADAVAEKYFHLPIEK